MQGHLQYYDFEKVQLWRFCFDEYVHNGSFNKPAYFDIPGLIKLKLSNGTNVGINMLS